MSDPKQKNSDKTRNVGGCQGTINGCCSDGHTQAKSKDDPCKSKPTNNKILLIVAIVAGILFLLGLVGVYFWKKVPDHPRV